ncbi:hypothetical protein VU04_10315 [Desulfobulbus sp. TB]|nr:hypothetical protein [Desulfobulbus sp. TB]
MNTSQFIGSAIATAGLSFLLPLTRPKELSDRFSDEVIEAIKEKNGTLVNNSDQRLIPFIWLLILLGFLVWFWTSHISQINPNDTFLGFVPTHMAVGFINYFFAAICSAIKHKV